jgi:hypothetical protein
MKILYKKVYQKWQQQSSLNKSLRKKSLNVSNLEHFGCGLGLNAEVEAGVLAVPHSGQRRRVLRRLLLQTGFPFFFQIL